MADFSFESEFEDSVSKGANAAARATALLAKEVSQLGRSEVTAARQALKLASAHDSVARAADRARRAEDKLHSATLAESGAARKSLSVASKQLQIAKARERLAEAPGATAPAGLGGTFAVASVAAAALAGWTKVIGTGIQIIGAGIEKSIDFASAVAGAAKFNETMRFSFNTLQGGAAQGEAAFQKARQLAVLLGEDVGATNERMRRLLAQQFSTEQSEGLIRMLADLRMVGIEGEKADRVLMALTQIKAKGRLQAEEMLQLAEAGVSISTVYEMLGKKLGKTRTELEKMQKAGKITSQDALDAVQSAALKLVGKDKAGEAGAEFAASTIAGMENTFASAKTLFLSDIADQAMPVFKKLGPIVQDMTRSLADPALQGKLAKSFGVIGDLLDRQGGKFGDDFSNGLNLAADAFDRIVTLGTAFTEGFIQGFRPFLDQLGTDGVSKIDGLKDSTQIFGVVAGDALGSIISNLNSLVATLDTVGAHADRIRGWFGAGEDLHTTGVALGDSFAAGITQSLLMSSGPMGAAAALAHSVKQAAEGALGIKSPSRVGAKIGAQFDAGVAAGMQGGASASAAGRLGMGIGTTASTAARSGVFHGSPAHRAMTTNNTRKSNSLSLDFTQNNFGTTGAQAAAEAKASLFDIGAFARAKFEIG